MWNSKIKFLMFCWALLLTATNLFAQKNDSLTITLKTDTIHLRGMIYTADGKPAKKMRVRLWQRGFYERGYDVTAQSDTSGYFELKWVNADDNLVIDDVHYNQVSFPINGSRYMVVYLPRPDINAINPLDTVVVKALKKHVKIKPSFRIPNKKDGVWVENFEKQPVPYGGFRKLTDFIRQNLVYPEKAIEGNIEGTVEITFTVEWNGALTDFKILRGLGYGCDEEVIAILKKYPKWKPGIYSGRPVTVQESIAVRFSLTDK